MLLDYAGKPQNYGKLASLMLTKSHGTAFSNLLFMENLGVKVAIRSGGFDGLFQLLCRNRPCILSVQTGELPHWRKPILLEDVPHALLLTGLDGRFAYINDPAFQIAPIMIEIAELDLARIDHDERYAFLE